MALYTRQQLVLLLTLLGAAGAGIAVDRWRGADPELAERLEQFDREPKRETASGETTLRPHAAVPGTPARPSGKLGASAPEGPVDINRATAEELTRLPGVGPALATRIVAARETGGRFGSVDELRRVRGVGRATLERLRPLVTVPDLPATDFAEPPRP